MEKSAGLNRAGRKSKNRTAEFLSRRGHMTRTQLQIPERLRAYRSNTSGDRQLVAVFPNTPHNDNFLELTGTGYTRAVVPSFCGLIAEYST